MRKIILAENIKRIRVANNLSQKQLAEKINVNFRTISAWEKSVCEPSLEMLVKLSDLFNESIDDLLF